MGGGIGRSLTLSPTRLAWRSADLRSGAVLRSSPLLPGRRPALRGQGRAGGGIVFRWNGAPSAVSASWSRICSSRDGARRSKPYRHLQVWVTNLIGSVNYSAPDKCPVLHKHLVSVSICVHPWLLDDFALPGNLRLRPPAGRKNLPVDLPNGTAPRTFPSLPPRSSIGASLCATSSAAHRMKTVTIKTACTSSPLRLKLSVENL